MLMFGVGRGVVTAIFLFFFRFLQDMTDFFLAPLTCMLLAPHTVYCWRLLVYGSSIYMTCSSGSRWYLFLRFFFVTDGQVYVGVGAGVHFG